MARGTETGRLITLRRTDRLDEAAGIGGDAVAVASDSMATAGAEAATAPALGNGTAKKAEAEAASSSTHSKDAALIAGKRENDECGRTRRLI